MTKQLGKKEKSLLTPEANMDALSGRVQNLKEIEMKLLADSQEFNKVATAAADVGEKDLSQSTAELAMIEQNEIVETSGGSGPSTGNHLSQTKSSDDEGDEKSEVIKEKIIKGAETENVPEVTEEKEPLSKEEEAITPTMDEHKSKAVPPKKEDGEPPVTEKDSSDGNDSNSEDIPLLRDEG